MKIYYNFLLLLLLLNATACQSEVSGPLSDALQKGEASQETTNDPATSVDVYGAFTISPIDINTTESGGTTSFTIRLNTAPSADVVVAVSSSDETEGIVAVDTVTFTPLNWRRDQTIKVTGIDDDLDDGDIDFSIVLQSAISDDAQYNGQDPDDLTLSNEDDDSVGIAVSGISTHVTEAGGTATFTIKLNAICISDVTISLATSDLSEGTVSPSSVTFTPENWSERQTITVTGVDDSIRDGNKNFRILTSKANSADTAYNDMAASDVIVSNLDDEVSGVVVSAISGNTNEAGASATFTVQLSSQPIKTVSMSLSSSDTTEGTVSPNRLAFSSANWNIPQTVTITGKNDYRDDGDKNYSIRFSKTSSNSDEYDNLAVSSVALKNLDDETAGFNISAISGNTSESGVTASFTITLTSQPKQSVKINVASSDTSEGTVSISSITFVPARWNRVQTVTVTGVDDSITDGDITYSIVLGNAISKDSTYSGVDAVDVSIINSDNEVATTTTTTTTLTSGTQQVVSGEISYSGEVDIYNLTPTTSGYVYFYTTGSTDTYCTVGYGYDDDSGIGTNCKYHFSVTAGSIYTISIRSYGSGTGSYSLYYAVLSTADSVAKSIISNGSYEKPYMSWSSSCNTSTDILQTYAMKLCWQSGYTDYTFSSLSGTLCNGSSIVNTTGYYYLYDTDSIYYGNLQNELILYAYCR